MKIIQICSDKHGLYGLTEAGEIWEYIVGLGWHKIPPLPAEDEAEAEAELAD